jgi:hypothetical protein
MARAEIGALSLVNREVLLDTNNPLFDFACVAEARPIGAIVHC